MNSKDESQQNTTLKKGQLTVQQCRAILESEGENYTDEQIKSIRELFYLLAELHLQSLTSQNKSEND